jgi:DNA/RNA endonuclease YhcR with UshA esterase domain
MDWEPDEKEYSDSASKKDLIEEGRCPTCGYQVGGDSTCPRCGARVEKTTPVKLVRTIALIGSLVGIVLLWTAAYYKQPPTIKLEDIQETMNNALVRIEGTVDRMQINESSNNFSIELSQGPYSLELRAFNNLHRFQDYFGDNFPQEYDTIRVTGTLNTSIEYGNKMYLSIPERLEVIDRCQPEPYNLLDLSTEDVGRCVLVEGKVSDVREFSAGKSISLVKGGLETPLTVFEWEEEDLPAEVRENMTTVGATLEVFANVGIYRGDLQLQLVDPSDPKAITVKNVPDKKTKTTKTNAYERINTGSVSVDQKGRTYRVYARVVGVREFSSGVSLMIDDQTGEVPLVIFEGDAKKIDDFDKLKNKGAVFQARVRVGEYRDKPQLQIADPKSVRVQ